MLVAWVNMSAMLLSHWIAKRNYVCTLNDVQAPGLLNKYIFI